MLILFLFGIHFLQRRLRFHYIHTFIMFKHAEFGKHTWIHTSKIKKNMLILKFHPGMKCLHVFFSFFHLGMKLHPCLSSQDEVSSRPKRVNSKRHFTIDRGDFIPGRVSRVNTFWDLTFFPRVYLINQRNYFANRKLYRTSLFIEN